MTKPLLIAAIVCLYVGWIAMEPWIVPATGIEDLSDEQIAAGLQKVILGIVESQLPASEA